MAKTIWLLPVNMDRFSPDQAFQTARTELWGQPKQMNTVKPGDEALLYEGVPNQYISWKCRVKWVDLPDPDDPDNPDARCVELEALYPYHDELRRSLLSLPELNIHGLVRWPQGPMRVTEAGNPELSAYLSYVDRCEACCETPIPFRSMGQGETPPEGIASYSADSPEIFQFYTRNPEIAWRTKIRAAGKCELCGAPAPFRDKSGFPYLECHHIVWRSQGGEDVPENTAALCPNCHRRVHILRYERDAEALREVRRVKP
ncbi:MAG: HNH endonuclease [Oscillibacter sp.]|nr:HNH endonuclease [Oscillibacter sp.]